MLLGHGYSELGFRRNKPLNIIIFLFKLVLLSTSPQNDSQTQPLGDGTSRGSLTSVLERSPFILNLLFSGSLLLYTLLPCWAATVSNKWKCSVHACKLYFCWNPKLSLYVCVAVSFPHWAFPKPERLHFDTVFFRTFVKIKIGILKILIFILTWL